MAWTQDNIELFGGDKTMVTIAGESAGASSVSLHLLSPGSRSLFLRAISESGGPTTRWAKASIDYGTKAALALSQQMSCGEDWTSLISCLRSKSADDLLDAQEAVYSRYSVTTYESPFTPVVDGVVIPSDPLDMLRSGDFSKIDYMSGVNHDEYSLFLLPHVGDTIHIDTDGQASINSTVFSTTVDHELSGPGGPIAGVPSSNKAIRDAVMYEYTNWTNRSSDEARLQQLIQAGSDSLFTCPLTQVAQSWTNASYASQGAKLYVYRFSHTTGIFPSWAGVPHASELPFVLGEPLVRSSAPKAPLGPAHKSPGVYQFTEEDKTVSQHFIRLWSAFVRTG